MDVTQFECAFLGEVEGELFRLQIINLLVARGARGRVKALKEVRGKRPTISLANLTL